ARCATTSRTRGSPTGSWLPRRARATHTNRSSGCTGSPLPLRRRQRRSEDAASTSNPATLMSSLIDTEAPAAPPPAPTIYRKSHLSQLEAEAIYVMREVAAQFERPVLLFSGGKDSILMTHLARKAFAPAKFPFPLMHIDTGHNFPEAIEFRDWL